MRKSFQLLVGALVLGGAAFAQIAPPAQAPDSYLLGYTANLSQASTLNMTNTGSIDGVDPTGDICANVYVFAQDQQLISCCTCPLTPNHLRTLSVQSDLISNTLTPGVPTGITVGLVASANPTGGACDATNPGRLAPGLRAWMTVPHAAPGGTFALTENALLPAFLSGGEFNKMLTYCEFIKNNGSTFGICGSCRDGAAGAARK